MKYLFIILSFLFCSCSMTFVKETKTPIIPYCFDVNYRLVRFIENGRELLSKDDSIKEVKAELFDVECDTSLSFTGTAIIDFKYIDDKNFKEPTMLCSRLSIVVIADYDSNNITDIPDFLEYDSVQVIDLRKCE